MNQNGNKPEVSDVLIQNAIEGSESAFREIYDFLSGKMYSLCLRYAGDTETANDYFQEGFIKLYRNLANFRHEGSFEGWARRIFVTSCLDELRKRKIQFAEINEDFNVVSPELSANDRLDLRDLLKIIQGIPDGYRTIVNLYLIEGYSHSEIATMLGISENGSKSKLHKARLYLKELLATSEI